MRRHATGWDNWTGLGAGAGPLAAAIARPGLLATRSAVPPGQISSTVDSTAPMATATATRSCC
jgi:hypothetical protein